MTETKPMDKRAAYTALIEKRNRLTLQQLRTMMGQINAGDITGAMKGLERLMARQARKAGAGK